MNTHRLSRPLVTLLLTLTAAAAHAGEWSHILGPSLDRKSAGTAAPWSGGAPKVIWKIPAATGFSSFVTGDGRAYTVITTPSDGAARETALSGF